jgi:hypothetical protein
MFHPQAGGRFCRPPARPRRFSAPRPMKSEEPFQRNLSPRRAAPQNPPGARRDRIAFLRVHPTAPDGNPGALPKAFAEGQTPEARPPSRATGSVPSSPQGIPEPPPPRQVPKPSGLFVTRAFAAAAANRRSRRTGRGSAPMRRIPQPKSPRSLRFGFPPPAEGAARRKRGPAEPKGRRKKGPPLRKGLAYPEPSPGEGGGITQVPS